MGAKFCRAGERGEYMLTWRKFNGSRVRHSKDTWKSFFLFEESSAYSKDP